VDYSGNALGALPLRQGCLLQGCDSIGTRPLDLEGEEPSLPTANYIGPARLTVVAAGLDRVALRLIVEPF